MKSKKRLTNLAPKLRPVQTRRVTMLGKNTASLYLSAEWRSLMSRLLADRGRRCEACGRSDCRIFGDHVHELKDGGAPLDPGNVQLLCGSCHSAKTARIRAIRTRETSPVTAEGGRAKV